MEKCKNAKLMKIVHIVWELNIGGAETMLADILNEQVEYGNLHLIVINKAYDQTIVNSLDNRVNKYFIGRSPGSINLVPILKLNLAILSISPDIIHCHNQDIISILYHRKRKIICTVHGLGRKKKYLEKYNSLISISDTVKMDVMSRINLDSVRIYNGVKTSAIIMKHDYGKKGTFKILSVGRLIHEVKGQHVLLRALALLKNKNIFVDIVGEGPSEDYLSQQITKWELSNIRLLGKKSRDWTYANMNKYDLIIQPSLSEGFGLVLVESMAAKIPLLVSDISAHMEILKGASFGISYRKHDCHDLASKIEYMVDRNFDLKMLNLARRRVENKYNIKTTSMKYIGYYKTVIG
jgi:glycosyltransferase involved in cell wall biosynthesis